MYESSDLSQNIMKIKDKFNSMKVIGVFGLIIAHNNLIHNCL